MLADQPEEALTDIAERTIARPPSASDILEELKVVRQRRGVTPERLEECPSILRLSAVHSAMERGKRRPEDAPAVANDLLQCEITSGLYSDVQRSVLQLTLNFGEFQNDLTDRRELLRTRHSLFGNDYVRVERGAYLRYANQLVGLRSNPCESPESQSNWTTTLKKIQTHQDETARLAIESALHNFGFGRTRAEAIEKAKRFLEQLPLAQDRLSHTPLGPAAEATNVLKPVPLGLDRLLDTPPRPGGQADRTYQAMELLRRAVAADYTDWVRGMRYLHNSPDVFLKTSTVALLGALLNTEALPESAEERDYLLANTEETTYVQSLPSVRNYLYLLRNTRTLGEHKFIERSQVYDGVTVVDSPIPGAKPTATYYGALENSIRLVGQILLSLEQRDDWERILPPPSMDGAELAPR